MYTIREVNGTIVDCEPRCWRCEKLLAVKMGRPWVIVCQRCKARNCNPLESDDILTPAETGAMVTANELNTTG